MGGGEARGGERLAVFEEFDEAGEPEGGGVGELVGQEGEVGDAGLAFADVEVAEGREGDADEEFQGMVTRS